MPFVAPVRGATFLPISLAGSHVGQPIRLEPEPNNPVDPLAILVKRLDGYPLGWLPRDVAARIYAQQWSGLVVEVYKRRGEITGLRIRLSPRRHQVSSTGTKGES